MTFIDPTDRDAVIAAIDKRLAELGVDVSKLPGHIADRHRDAIRHSDALEALGFGEAPVGAVDDLLARAEEQRKNNEREN